MDIRDIGAVKITNHKIDYLSQQQNITARNVANANTPKFKALEMKPFNQVVKGNTSLSQPIRTHDKHIGGLRGAHSENVVLNKTSPMSPDGNTVSLEQEALTAAKTQSEHSFATASLKKAASLIALSIKQ